MIKREENDNDNLGCVNSFRIYFILKERGKCNDNLDLLNNIRICFVN